MATITRRAAGKWQVKIRRQGFGQMTRTFDSHADALAWSRRIESETDSGTFVDRQEANAVTFADILRRYRKEITPKKRGAAQELSKIDQYLTHPIINRPLSMIGPRDMVELRDWRLESVSPGTVLREFCVLRNAFEVASREWFLPVDNPVRKIRLPSANRARERRLRPGEFDQLIRACRAYGGLLPSAVEWLIETGMRREEACKLLRSDIDLDAGIAKISRSKNGTSRSVPLTTRAAEIISALRRDPSHLVFGIRPDSVTQAFGRACERAGIRDLTLHDLRHEATSRFVELGFSMPEVMAITGHRDPRMMLRYYQPDARKLAKRMRSQS